MLGHTDGPTLGRALLSDLARLWYLEVAALEAFRRWWGLPQDWPWDGTLCDLVQLHELGGVVQPLQFQPLYVCDGS